MKGNTVAGTAVPVDINKLSRGLATTFRGVTEVFEAIGAETVPGFGTATQAVSDEPKKAKETETPTEESVKEPEQASEPAEDPKPAEASEATEQPEPVEPEQEQPAKAKEEKKSSMTVDDLIKVAAQKVKAKKENSDRIGALVKSYGVDSLKDLPEDRFEDFFTDLTQI